MLIIWYQKHPCVELRCRWSSAMVCPKHTNRRVQRNCT